MSKESQPLFDAVKAHIDENVAPIIEAGGVFEYAKQSGMMAK